METLARIRNEVLTRDNAWAAFTFVAVIAGAALSRKLLKSGWRKTTGTEPPLNPHWEETNWIRALTWGVLTGALGGNTRAVSHGCQLLPREVELSRKLHFPSAAVKTRAAATGDRA
ncbi:MAG: DUF4235 domain-containing protein [Verrucomicrobiota bacterium]|nr:DUF4235 domain-containing protein [Verrucomicrobiota bacterium]